MNQIDYRNLAAYKGQTLAAREILEICGYSPKTYIKDTFLAQKKIIVEVLGTYPTGWYVEIDWGLFGE